MNLTRSRIAPIAVVAIFGSFVIAACGSSKSNSGFSGGGGGSSGGGGSAGGSGAGSTVAEGGTVFDLDASGGLGSMDAPFDPDAFFANDPPPMYCGPDGGASSVPDPGGTADCPGDKNREGCPCTDVGQTAACWPGLRVNRDLGVCKDGTTTCVSQNELNKVWGPCVGYVLPTPGATSGAAACKCFSEGQWTIDNTEPCISQDNSFAISTVLDGMMPECPMLTQNPTTAPTQSWSTDSLTVDCAGTFTLCYELKAGTSTAPSASDCSVAKVCIPQTFYPTANQPFVLPPLPGWLSTDKACIAKFTSTGGYGEMSVLGTSVRCDSIDNGSGGAYVFSRNQYCPLDSDAGDCVSGGSGSFGN